MIKRALLVWVVCGMLATVLIGYLAWRSSTGQSRGSGVMTPGSFPKSEDRSARFSPPSAEQRWGRFGGARQIDFAGIQRAIDSGDRMQWSPAIGELARPEYDPAETIPFLLPMLENRDPAIRIRVAIVLFELGSKDGVGPLLAIIADGAAGRIDNPEVVQHAAEVLHQYRVKIDSELLFEAYKRFNLRSMISTLLLQQVPQLAEEALAGLKYPPDGGGTQGLAAALGLKDPEAIRGYEELLAYWPSFRLAGNLGLYRATGDPSRLQYIIDTAEEGVGLLPETEKVGDTTTRQSLQILATTVNPATTQALREIIDYSVEKHFDNMVFDPSFSALFYVHRDYDFVDDLMLRFLKKEMPDPGIDRNLLYRVAAARNTPELRQAAEEFNHDAFYRYFILCYGQPIERWIGMSQVPINLRVASDP